MCHRRSVDGQHPAAVDGWGDNSQFHLLRVRSRAGDGLTMCCWDCGCFEPTNSHGDSRHITTETLRSAAAANETDVPTVVANITHTLALHRGRQRASKELDADVACQVLKSSEERRYTLGLAYPANRADVGKAQDGFRDFVGKDALEEAAWSFLHKSGQVGVQHLDGTEGHGVVVESYIWRGGDWAVTASDGSEQTIKAGDWLLGVVWDEPTWDAIKAGELNGFSPQGRARRRVPSAEALANLRSF